MQNDECRVQNEEVNFVLHSAFGHSAFGRFGYAASRIADLSLLMTTVSHRSMLSSLNR
jgi:hypothetical protein